jgi:hypothetical protein
MKKVILQQAFEELCDAISYYKKNRLDWGLD